jgi:hypothetical protein
MDETVDQRWEAPVGDGDGGGDGQERHGQDDGNRVGVGEKRGCDG